MGVTAWLSEVLKTSVSCSAQSFSTRPGILSGPAALRGLILDRVFLTSAGDRLIADRWEVWAVFVQMCRSAFGCADVSFCRSVVQPVAQITLNKAFLSTKCI